MLLQKFRSLTFLRSLHIGNTKHIKTNFTNVNSESDFLNLEKPEFITIGQPPTLVQIKLVPSYPVHISKGSLLSLYGTSLKNISFTNEWLGNPFKRLFYGIHSLRYQKLESIASATSLITVDKDSTVSTLSLDGTVDWAILPNDAIVGYSGPTLRINIESLPRYVKAEAKKWFTLSNNSETKTGLYNVWKSGYSLVQGRGDIILKGYGSIFKVDLDAEEQILIKKNNIIGISVNGDELSKCVSEYQGFNNKFKSTNETSTEIVEITTKMQLQKYLRKMKEYLISTYRFITKSSDGYVNVVGPRTVLLQSDLAPSLLSKISSVEDQSIEVLENKIFKASLQENNKAQDYLSYVTVKNGKVSFQSTPDFQKTIDAMPKANRLENQ